MNQVEASAPEQQSQCPCASKRARPITGLASSRRREPARPLDHRVNRLPYRAFAEQGRGVGTGSRHVIMSERIVAARETQAANGAQGTAAADADAGAALAKPGLAGTGALVPGACGGGSG